MRLITKVAHWQVRMILMASLHTIPVLVSILVGLALCLLIWGFWRRRRPYREGDWNVPHDGLFVGLLLLAACASGIFVTYVLLNVTL